MLYIGGQVMLYIGGQVMLVIYKALFSMQFLFGTLFVWMLIRVWKGRVKSNI